MDDKKLNRYVAYAAIASSVITCIAFVITLMAFKSSIDQFNKTYDLSLKQWEQQLKYIEANKSINWGKLNLTFQSIFDMILDEYFEPLNPIEYPPLPLKEGQVYEYSYTSKLSSSLELQCSWLNRLSNILKSEIDNPFLAENKQLYNKWHSVISRIDFSHDLCQRHMKGDKTFPFEFKQQYLPIQKGILEIWKEVREYPER